MSVRFNSSSDSLTRTTNLPSNTSVTFFGWTKFINAGAGTRRLLYTFTNAGATAQQHLEIFTDNQLYIIADSTVAFTSHPPTDGTWFAWYLRCAATGAGAVQAGWRAQGGGSWTTRTATGASFTPSGIGLGGAGFAQTTDAEFAYFKVFDVALTDAQRDAQFRRPWPVVATRMRLDLLASASAGTDTSGNGYGFTAANLSDGASNPTFNAVPAPLLSRQPTQLFRGCR